MDHKDLLFDLSRHKMVESAPDRRFLLCFLCLFVCVFCVRFVLCFNHTRESIGDGKLDLSTENVPRLCVAFLKIVFCLSSFVL